MFLISSFLSMYYMDSCGINWLSYRKTTTFIHVVYEPALIYCFASYALNTVDPSLLFS